MTDIDQAEHWCALCPASHPTREALDKHTAAEHPATMIGVSARLRQLQQALAVSQADLTRAIEDRNAWARAARSLEGQRAELTEERDLARAALASARTELDLWHDGRRWEVARQPVGPCGLCGLPIVRGHAVEPMPGTTKGAFGHVVCPEGGTDG